MLDYKTLQVRRVAQTLLHVSLNRPTKLNAFNAQLFADLAAFFTSVNKDPEVRAVVLTGNGKHFTAGLDLKQYGSSLGIQDAADPSRQAIKYLQLLKTMQAQMLTVLDCRVPVLVGIHGFCIGAGIDLSTFADIRYCTEDSKFTIKEVDIGLAADIGTLQMFPVVTSYSSFFKEMAFTGRFFDAQEAYKNGLVSRVYKTNQQMEEKLLELGKQIASKSPVAIWAIKNVLTRQIKKDFVDNFDHMAIVNMAMLQTNDMKLAVMATLSKEKPQFPRL